MLDNRCMNRPSGHSRCDGRGGGTIAGGGRRGSSTHALVHDVQLAFARSTQPVLYAMAAVLALAFVIALVWLPRGRLEPALAPAAPATPVEDT